MPYGESWAQRSELLIRISFKQAKNPLTNNFMKRYFLLALMISVLTTACRKIEIDGDDNPGPGTGNEENLVLSGRISSDKTLQSGKTYKLRGIVYVVDGATLTIEPGTRVEGEKSTRGALIITRGYIRRLGWYRIIGKSPYQ